MANENGKTSSQKPGRLEDPDPLTGSEMTSSRTTERRTGTADSCHVDGRSQPTRCTYIGAGEGLPPLRTLHGDTARDAPVLTRRRCDRRRVARSAGGVALGDPRRPAAHDRPPPSTAARSSADAPALRVTAAGGRAGRLLWASQRLAHVHDGPGCAAPSSRRTGPATRVPRGRCLDPAKYPKSPTTPELPVSGRLASRPSRAPSLFIR